MDVWYYELTNDGFDLRTTRRPIQGSQIPDFLAKWEKREEAENSWIVPIERDRTAGLGPLRSESQQGREF